MASDATCHGVLWLRDQIVLKYLSMTCGLGSDLSFNPAFDDAWLERCSRTRLFVEGEVAYHRLVDYANVSWVTASTRWTSEVGGGRLQREAELMRRNRLHPDWALIPEGTLRTTERLILVYGVARESTLESLMRTGSLSLSRILRVATGAARALSEVHANDLCHRDIRPATIIEADNGRILLASFGYAADLLCGGTEAGLQWNFDAIAFAAPEQARRYHAYSDHTSDLYSLGVVLYLMLTGTLPLRADSLADWLHAHVAVQPVPPDQLKAMPAQLSGLVLKLLCKDPASRYQSANALHADLVRCLTEWDEHGVISPFELGLSGAAPVIGLPGYLFGRTEELEVLQAAFKRVAQSGTPELVLVAGAPGSGKSALVSTLLSITNSTGTRTATGKSDQLQRDMPYAPIAQLLRTLTVSLLGEDDSALAGTRAKLISRIAGNGQLLIDLVPEIEDVIGSCGPLPDQPPASALARANRTILAAMSAFAEIGRPLIVFLDDLQWADAATLSLLSAFATQPPDHVLLVGSYRNHSAEMEEAVAPWLALLRRRTMRLTEIEIEALSVRDITALIAVVLDRREEEIKALADVVHEKSAGNPFFAGQLLRILVDEGALIFDADLGKWIWDGSTDSMRRRYTDNVLDLMIRRLDRLSLDSREVIRQLACIGHRSDASLLASVTALRPNQLALATQTLVELGLLLRDGSGYTFPHDRVLEAAYGLTPIDVRPIEHARIASIMLDHWRDVPTEFAFEIASQIERASRNALPAGMRVAFAEALLTAARCAKKAAAIEQAVSYLAIASDMVEPAWWSTNYSVAVAIGILNCECLLAHAQLDDAAHALDSLLPNAVVPCDKAAAYRVKAMLQTIHGDYEGAISAALKGLALLGVELDRSGSPQLVRQAYEAALESLAGRDIKDIADLPLARDERIEALMGLLSTLIASLFVNDELKFFHLAKMVELSLTHGVTQDSAYGFAWFGVLIAFLYEDYDEGLAYAEAGLNLARRLNDESGYTAALVAVDQISPWTRSLAFALNSIREAVALARAAGDVGMQCYVFNHLISDLTAMGENLGRVEVEAQSGLELTRHVRYKDIERILSAQMLYVRGLRRGPDSVYDATLDMSEHEGISMSTLFLMRVYDGMTAFFKGDHLHAVKRFMEADPLEWAMPAHIDTCSNTFFGALALSQSAVQDGGRSHAIAMMLPRRERLSRWATRNPLTFLNKLLLVDAELARLQGEDAHALQCFEKSASAAAAAGLVHEQALAHEFAGLHCEAMELKTAARQHARIAHDCYRRWGADHKAKMLEMRHPFLVDDLVDNTASSSALSDLEIGMKAASALANETTLDRLIEKLMANMLVHAGAQYGLLLLMQDNELAIKAKGTLENGHLVVTADTCLLSEESFSRAVVNSVVRTARTVIVEDAQAEALTLLANEPKSRSLRSVLGLPLVSRGSFIGVLYLENNLIPNVFVAGQTSMLEVLASQAAISIETARLYNALLDENAQRARSETALANARAELARTSHLIVMGALAASIAHEIQQPLAGLITCADATLRWLERPTPNIPEALQGIHQIKSDGMRAVDIVRALRSLANQAPKAHGAIVVDEVIRDVTNLIRTTIDAHGVTLITTLNTSDAVVIADRIQLQQIVVNLMNNAIDAMKGVPREVREMRVSSATEGAYVVVRVEDRGSGMSSETLTRIFQPFFTTKETGMGMGLAICRSIMEAQGGTLDAQSIEGIGSTFTFRIPLAKETELIELGIIAEVT
ncbi:histidine kinase (plasmid) [Burkholderia sp. JP2-270]|uniref:trifunctional serine/threonine-protein kinase/ATP-binding protein/sensor histidine kinase n=1 Tax=Burkholderia sp. JP2-270 TaxID=2217913 RepID=UPI000DA38550|nr:trifunctional serine/threonine-protein kinase/ATP-binding protein/sensor histidine kinase [Burkholderia sp. JP2-270]AWV05522.1 histidine kinase [Burkholderia sp. JP2-270]